MPKVSVVDISDPNKIKEIFNDDEEETTKNDVAIDTDSDSDDDEDLGIVPRILFSTFSTLTILIPLISVHIALDIIIHQQYAQDFDVVEIAARAATAAIGTLLTANTLTRFYSSSISDWSCSSEKGCSRSSRRVILCVFGLGSGNDTCEQRWFLLCCHGISP